MCWAIIWQYWSAFRWLRVDISSIIRWSELNISAWTRLSVRWWSDLSIVDDVLWTLIWGVESIALFAMLFCFFISCGYKQTIWPFIDEVARGAHSCIMPLQSLRKKKGKPKLQEYPLSVASNNTRETRDMQSIATEHENLCTEVLAVCLRRTMSLNYFCLRFK
ncbi:hypothetical protein POM88_015641 [Heracleum sosnowskyi]|uniref:Uncharacterized protein n=1 Tax=Heracleum sosnowskyi TaxID=360622 RepID=A0AAD8IML0_9APIA|nr:hypothetical protein POM88_015641 [Heracleum sosnowskyi]